jgi:hypothetical protein
MDERESRSVPGAGNYEPKNATVQQKAPGWVLGKEHRGGVDDSRKNFPGAGTYELKSRIGEAPKFVMG